MSDSAYRGAMYLRVQNPAWMSLLSSTRHGASPVWQSTTHHEILVHKLGPRSQLIYVVVWRAKSGQLLTQVLQYT